MKIENLQVQQVAGWLGAEIVGNAQMTIVALATLSEAGSNDLTYAADTRRLRQLASSNAGAAIVSEVINSRDDMTFLVVDDVELAWNEVLKNISARPAVCDPGVHATAYIDPSAKIAADVSIGPFAVIGRDVSIDTACVLGAHVTIGEGVTVGSRCTLHPGVVIGDGCVLGCDIEIGPNGVIGHDGFGYITRSGVHHKVPHIGNVVIEDNVEIGAGGCIDRGKFDSTVIGAGSKIDNLVQIAHNVRIGPGCILAGQCGVAGSTVLGRYVVIGGSSGIRDNITLGDEAKVTAYSGVAQSVEAGDIVGGTPADSVRKLHRFYALRPKIPALVHTVKKLESKMKTIESPKTD